MLWTENVIIRKRYEQKMLWMENAMNGKRYERNVIHIKT